MFRLLAQNSVAILFKPLATAEPSTPDTSTDSGPFPAPSPGTVTAAPLNFPQISIIDQDVMPDDGGGAGSEF